MREICNTLAIITGAGSGIGRALAQELGGRGAKLALADINEAALEETRKLVRAPAIQTYILDVSDGAAMKAFAARVEQDFERASLLINNAGVALHGTFAETSQEDFEWIMKINFWGVVYACRFFLPMLRRESEAHIVNISSVFGLIGAPGQAAYSSSKFAVRGFSEALAQELVDTTIRVTSVHPAGIKTNIAKNARAAMGLGIGAKAKYEELFESFALTTSDEAAHAIVRAVLANKTRVLIGPDAKRIDILQRLTPTHATRLLRKVMERRGGQLAEMYLGRQS